MSAASPFSVIPDRALRAHHQAAVGEEVEVGDDGVKIQAGFIDNLRFGSPPHTLVRYLVGSGPCNACVT